MAGTDWVAQLKEIAGDLTTLEVNTIEASGMTGRKMPVWPHALIDIAQKYADFLTGPAVRLDLDAFAADYADPANARPGIARTPPEAVEPAAGSAGAGGGQEDPEGDPHGPHQLSVQFKKDASFYSFELTNGPETFDLLRWAAANVLSLDHEAAAGQREPAPPASGEHGPPPALDPASRPIVMRIQRSSDQLKTVAKALGDLAHTHVGVTRDQLLRCGEEGTGIPVAPAALLTRIRKAWDIGADRIVLQTVVQLDGDVIFRARNDALRGANQVFAHAHERATNTSLGHWRSLFDLVTGLLIGRTGRVLERTYKPGA